MKTLFVLAMICFIAGTVLLLLGSRDKRPENGKNGKKLYRIFTAATLGVVVILGVVQLIAGFASDEYRSVFVLMGLAALVQALLIFWSKKRSNSKVLRFAAKALFVSAMLELTLFNIPSYRLWFGDYPEVTLTPSQADEVSGNSAAHGWGSAGSNGAQAVVTATDQQLEGDIAVDAISSLDLTLSGSSVLTGTVNIIDNAEGGTSDSSEVNVTVDNGSTWILTGNCTVTTLTNNGTIDFNGYTITLADGTVLS